MKFIKVVSVKRQYYQRFGDLENIDKAHYLRKYGNIKDPKNGTRPYLLLKDENNILWVIPSTSKSSVKKIELMTEHPERFIKYYSFKYGEKKITHFELLNMSPITEEYLSDYKISYWDNKDYLKISEMKEEPSHFLLRQIINTNYCLKNGTALHKWDIKENSEEWNKFINQVENKANYWKKQTVKKFYLVRTNNIIRELYKDL